MRWRLRGASASDQPNQCGRRNGRGSDALGCTPPLRHSARVGGVTTVPSADGEPCTGSVQDVAFPVSAAGATWTHPPEDEHSRRPKRPEPATASGDRPVTRTGALSSCRRGPVSAALPTLSGFSALATQMMQRQTEKLSRGYFPRAVFFFGFGFLVLPVLAGAASFFGRFGDAGSLLPWLAVPGWLRVRIRSEAPSRPAGRSARRYRSASPACQITQPSCPSPETAIVNGCGKRARPAKVARRCLPLSLSRATAASQLSQQTTRHESGSASADQATPS